MDKTAEQTKFLDKTKFFVTKTATEEFSEKLIYHNIERIIRVVNAVKEIGRAENISTEDQDLVTITAWLSLIGFRDLNKFSEIKGPHDIDANVMLHSNSIASEFLTDIQYPEQKRERVLKLISRLPDDFSMENDPDLHLSKILADAKAIDWSTSQSGELSKLLYQELLMTGVFSTGTAGWKDIGFEFLTTHKYLTTYGISHLEPKKLKSVESLKKQKKKILKNQKALLKKELNISDDELKKLKKSLKSVKGRDDKGIQTMFRTTSRNHYTLNQMVDGKANIMISVNAIILSLILSRIIGKVETWCIHNAPILIMLITCSLSVIFAVLAIRPPKSHGEFTEEDIRNRQGNLLYFGNYHNMSFRDYQWGMLQMINDGDNLYTTMIRDLYFMGQMLERKYNHLRYSLNVFMIGFILAVILFIIASSMPDFHIAGTH